MEIKKNKFYIDDKLNTYFIEDNGTDIVGARIANDKGICRYGNRQSRYRKLDKSFLIQEIEVNKISNISYIGPTFKIEIISIIYDSISLSLLGNNSKNIKSKQNIIQEINDKQKILSGRLYSYKTPIGFLK